MKSFLPTATILSVIVFPISKGTSEPPASTSTARDAIQYIEPTDSGSSMAVVVGPTALVHTAQLLPLDAKGGLIAGGLANQVNRVFDNLRLALISPKSGFDRLIKLNVYVTDNEAAAEIRRRLAELFAGRVRPAVTFVTTKLSHPGARVAIDAVAAGASRGGATPVLYPAIPVVYSRFGGAVTAVLPAGGAVYFSGQAAPGDLAAATRKTLEQLAASLAHVGLSRDEVVQIKAFLNPMADITLVEKEMAAFYGGKAIPPTAFVEWVSSGPSIEIELVAAAARKGPPSPTEAIRFITLPGQKASPVFSHATAIRPARMVYFGGLCGDDTSTAEKQVRSAFATLEHLCRKTGTDLNHLAKATYYVSDGDVSRKLNEVRTKVYDPRRPPAASKAMVRGVGAEGKNLVMDMIAVAGD